MLFSGISIGRQQENRNSSNARSADEGGRSNAQLADARNPHPAGIPLHEYVWKTVFLHSLVGRSEGLNSNLFGITEQEALVDVSFPGLTPPQVQTALDEIKENAFYLRFYEGRYYAHTDPTINRALASIRRGLSRDEVAELLATRARKVVQAGDRGPSGSSTMSLRPSTSPTGATSRFWRS